MIVFIISWNRKNKNSITDYAAIADGKTNNAVSIQSAIDQVAKNGGGQEMIFRKY
jgi:polygalacturonase